MSNSIFDLLIEKNEFPIVFIGSGISRRYLKEYPSWEQLLEELWKLTSDDNFFAHLNKVRKELKTSGITNDSEIEFLVNTQVATEIEVEINSKFYNEEITIDGLEQKMVYRQNISPFKKLLSNRFNQYEFIDNIDDEFKEFKNMLGKAQIILTTNYDTLIEESYDSVSECGFKAYIGQQGFFKQTMGYAELYKIHGCVTQPTSLIINREDYEKFDCNSVLISAKIISMLLNSPIIFLGYSLTDRNVRKIIRDFTGSLNAEEKIQLEKRLILVQWEKNIQDIKEEVIIDKDLGCRLTVIRTDNFTDVYKFIATINQGVAPSEVRRYQSVIKQLIVERGKAGRLNTLLCSPSELDNLEEIIRNQNIVVAIGDSKIIFSMPNVVEYIYDYISESTEQNIDILLRFIASQQGMLPILKYVKEEIIESSSLHKTQQEKLRKRLKEMNLKAHIDALPFKTRHSNIESILEGGLSANAKHSLIAYNFDEIGIEKIRTYILKEFNQLKKNGEIKVESALRRLTLIYDLKNHTKI